MTPNPTVNLRPVKLSALLALCAAALLALSALIVVSLASGRDDGNHPAPTKLAFDGALMPPGARAAEFALHDQNGRTIRMADFRGRTVIVTFLYADCTSSCPAQAQQIKGALDDLGHDLPAIAVSVDPAHDTPAKARDFLAKQGMGKRIRWALGTERQLAAVWKKFGIAPQRPGHEHQSWMTLVDKREVQRVGYPGAEVTPERLAHDLRILEKE
jgi:protein SCO1/2